MKREHEPQQRKTLPQQTAATDKVQLAPASAPHALSPKQIYRNERGQLTV
jgi:hypothetical protein